MSKPILLDTDVLIDFLRGYEKATSFVTINSKRIMVSAVVVAELFAGVRGGTGGAEQIVLENLLELFRVELRHVVESHVHDASRARWISRQLAGMMPAISL